MEQTLPQTGSDRTISSHIAGAAWLTILRGVIALVFGGVALFRPGIALTFLVALFGVYAFLDGILSLIASIRMVRRHDPWLALLFEAIVGIAAGIIAFRTPGITALALLFVIGAWAVVTGALEIATAIELRKLIPGEWALALAGVLSILFGCLLFWQPFAGIVALVWIIGIYAILFGILMVSVGIQMRRISEV